MNRLGNLMVMLIALMLTMAIVFSIAGCAILIERDIAELRELIEEPEETRVSRTYEWDTETDIPGVTTHHVLLTNQ